MADRAARAAGPPAEPAISSRPRIAIVGAGPAGLMAAEVAARGGAAVTVYERMPSPGRKLLLAGRGGLNLTHSEDAEAFLGRYREAASHLRAPLAAFGPQDLRRWCADLGIDTFVGASGRVFPRCFKASPLLRAWLRRLDSTGVGLATRHEWRGWAGDRLVFATKDGERRVDADAVVLALGGASWPQLGADGAWTNLLGDGVAPLRPANCGFAVAWSDVFRARFEGAPLKAIALEFRGERARGDLVTTRAGLEGGPIYALAPLLREVIAADGSALLHVALRPDMAHEALAARLARQARKNSLSNRLRKTLGLAPAAVGLLREAVLPQGQTLGSRSDDALARLVNAVPLRLVAPMSLDRAISTAGGIRFAAVDASLMVRARPGVFVAGEMLDWEAPTGGYLLQACFALGMAAGHGALAWARDAAAGDKKVDSRPNQSLPSAL